MKKTLILMAVLAMISLGAQAAPKYLSIGAVPNTNTSVVAFSNNLQTAMVPIRLYTELTGTITNTVTLTYVPSVSTNASDTGKTYLLGAAYTAVGGVEKVYELNTPAVASNLCNVILLPGDTLKLTGTTNLNTFVRCLFEVQ